MTPISHPLATVFVSTYIQKREELLSRNSDKLDLCDEERKQGVRINLLYDEYYHVFSIYSKEKYAMEFLDTFNSHRKTYAKGNIDTWIRLTKEEMLRMSMGEYRQVKEWTDRPDEEIISAIAIYAAWNDIICEHKNSEILKVFIEPIEEEPTEILEEEPLQVDLEENHNKSIEETSEPLPIIKTPTLENNRKVRKQSKRKSKKTLTGIALSRMVIRSGYLSFLKPLHKHINKKYIENISLEDFSENFEGKTSKEKLNWLATQYEFVYLFDNLGFILERRLYVKNGSAKLTELLQHFTFNKAKVSSASLRVARNRIKTFQKSPEKGEQNDFHEMKWNIEALDSILKELKQKIEEMEKTS